MRLSVSPRGIVWDPMDLWREGKGRIANRLAILRQGAPHTHRLSLDRGEDERIRDGGLVGTHQRVSSTVRGFFRGGPFSFPSHTSHSSPSLTLFTELIWINVLS